MRSTLIPVLLLAACLLLLCAPQSAPAQNAAPALRFDFGAKQSPVEPGWRQVTADARYSADAGFGFVSESQKSFHIERPAAAGNTHTNAQPHYDQYQTPLIVDGVRGAGDIVFRVDVAPGVYRVAVTLGDLLTPMGCISLYANDTLIEQNIHFHHAKYRVTSHGGEDISPDQCAVWGFYDVVRFTVDASCGYIQIKAARDDSEFNRLLALDEAKGGPDFPYARKQLVAEKKPPYHDIGERFRDIPLLAMEALPHTAAPVTCDKPGTLSYTGASKAVTDAVDAFNAKKFDAAVTLLKTGGAQDPLAAALVYSWIIGSCDYEGEEQLIPLAEGLLAQCLKADPSNSAALEAQRNLDTFDRALMGHLYRARPDGRGHFTENAVSCALFQFAQQDDPLYYKSLLHAARCAYQLDPLRWVVSSRTADYWMEEIERVCPANRFVQYFLHGQFDGVAGPWAMKDYTNLYEGAPAWAALEHEAFNRTLDLSEWWIHNRQKEDGSIGGGWGDDVEIVGLFGYYAYVSEGSSPMALKGARDLVNGLFNHSADVEPETGYLWHCADTEHSAEWTGDTLPMMLMIDYGNPLWIERAMLSAKLMQDLWTGFNDHGHRHFKANFLGGMGVGSGLQANDSAINMRATFPVQKVLWYNRHPVIEKLTVELADGWLTAAMSTDKDKPAGFIPPNVAWPTGELGGWKTGTWYEGNNAPGTVNYDFGAYKEYHLGLLQTAYELTGDKKYLEPIRLEAEAYDQMAAVQLNQDGKMKPKPGTPEFFKAGLMQSHGMWQKLSGHAAARTDGEAARAANVYESRKQQVANQSKFALDKYKTMWPVMTTEASATDRVVFPGVVDTFFNMTGGGLNGKTVSSLTAPVTYTGVGRDLAAFSTLSNSTELKLTVYLFKRGKQTLGIRPWDLQIGGEYEVSFAQDADDNGQPDGEAVVKQFTLEQRGLPCELELDGRVPYLISFRQTAPGREQKPLPDLSLWEGDIQYEAEHGYLTVRVHNTGCADADAIDVAVYEGTDTTGKLLAKEQISHLSWPNHFVPQTLKLGWRYTPKTDSATFTVVIDGGAAIEEITECNNAATRTITFDKSDVQKAVESQSRGEGGRGENRSGGAERGSDNSRGSSDNSRGGGSSRGSGGRGGR